MALREEFDKRYGIELVEIFTDINDLVEKTALKDFRKEIITHSDLKNNLNKNKNNFRKIYIEKVVLPKILAYCKKEKIDFDSACRMDDEIFVPHSDSFFWSYLALKLIACDVNLITQILDWNKKEFHKTENHDRRIASKEKINTADATKWEEERPFLLQVEHLIYGTVVSWMPVTDKLRLRKIMKWVDINKGKKLKNQSVQQLSKTDKLPFKTFDELFCDPEMIESCIDALRLVKPAVIDKNCDYLSGSREKSVIAAWIDAIKLRGKIKKANDKNLAYVLNNKFNGLNLSKDGRTLRASKTTAYNKYYTQFLTLIS